jgi:hypothetical protein
MIRALSIAGLLASLLISVASAEEEAVALDHERREALAALPLRLLVSALPDRVRASEIGQRASRRRAGSRRREHL